MTTPYLFSLEGKNYSVDLQSPLTISNLVLEITSKCNLRCTFCPKSEKDNDSIPGRDMDMPPSVIEETISFLNAENIKSISLVGVGEPTFRKDWIAVCDQLVQETGARLNLNTNFGRKLEAADLECLLKFNSIVISIESADASVQKELRRAVELNTIISNILALKMRARILGTKLPAFFVNCTVTQRNVLGLNELAVFCLELGIDQLNMSSLYESESANELGNLSIEYLSSEQLDIVNKIITQAQQLLTGTSTRLAIQPRLSQLLKGVKESSWSEKGFTRICLQPWGGYTVGANGQVFPCCVVADPFANIDEGKNCIVNGEQIRQFRKRLLEGELPAICQKCSNAPLGTKEELAKTVAAKAYSEGLAASWAPEVVPCAQTGKPIRNILIMHNCQTGDLGLALKEIFPDDKIMHHPLPVGFEEPSNDFVSLLNQALQVVDVLITSNRGMDLIKKNNLILNARVQTVLVPPIEFHAFHPDLCYIINKATGKLVSHHYNSAIAVWAYMRKYEVSDAVKLFNKSNYKALGYLSAWKPSFEHLKAQFMACDLDFDRFYLHVKRFGVFMYSTNHPKTLCIVRLAKIIATKMGCDDSIYNKEINIPDSLSHTIWPVYPEIADHLSLVEYANYWKFDRQIYINGVEKYVEHTFTNYRNQGINPEDMEYLSRDIDFYDSVLSRGNSYE